MSILELFCSVDDFWQQFAPNWQSSLLTAGQRQRLRATQMHPSEMMTIMILFHQSHYRTFKAYYTQYVQGHLRREFPQLVSYQRFVELMPAIRETLGNDVLHRTNRYLNNRLEQDHRGIKQRYYPMRGFGSVASASRFCRAFDEVRQFFRVRTTMKQQVSLAQQRELFRQRLDALKVVVAMA